MAHVNLNHYFDTVGAVQISKRLCLIFTFFFVTVVVSRLTHFNGTLNLQQWLGQAVSLWAQRSF